MQQSAATCVFIPVRTPASTTVRAGMLYRSRGQRVEKNRWYPWNLGRPDAYAIRILCLPYHSYRTKGRREEDTYQIKILHSPMSNDFLNVEIDPVRIVDDAAAAQVGALVEAQLSVADKRTTPPPPLLRESTDRGRLVVLVGTTGGGWGDSVLPVTDRLPPLLLLSSPSLSYPPPTLPSDNDIPCAAHIPELRYHFLRSRSLGSRRRSQGSVEIVAHEEFRTKEMGIKDPFPSLWSFFHNSVSKSLRLPSANHVCENRRVAKAFPGYITTILQIIFNLFRPRYLWHHTQAGVLNIYEVVEIMDPTYPASPLISLQLCFFIRHRKDFNCRILRHFCYLDRKGVFTFGYYILRYTRYSFFFSQRYKYL
ncbi:hypothetical protein ALC56_14244 [Trachymyrmex septentrionalis]|uniref:Uncharacterized protein n=1 Tax=Trachymyrmex septentrionalis TaxID=34720 RepID=A0A195ET05_9HYME|nr:hypothetical protein ALC56_14244 [Trachymyrmex septentrionalis]